MIDYAPAAAFQAAPSYERPRTMVSGLFRTRDLASLSTVPPSRASSWIVNGQKVWTSSVQFSTRMASCSPAPRRRIQSPHDDFRLFVHRKQCPASPSRPLRTMHGVDEFCEVYFDDVVIPSSRTLAAWETAGGLRWT